MATSYYLHEDEMPASPHWRLVAMEGARAVRDMAALPAAAPFLNLAPNGDGHPVLVLPGFLGDDRSTVALRRFAHRRGYEAFSWRLGQNLGPRTIGLTGDRLMRRLENIHRRTKRTVSIVGWSLGGIMARELAREAPDLVRQVITLGSPFNGSPSSSNVIGLYQQMTGDVMDDKRAQELEEMRDAPPGIPTTAIYTKLDGVVAWQNCLEDEGPMTDNIEVRTSHCGLGFNAAVFYAIADRLALPENQWQPFVRSGWRKLVYPTSGHGAVRRAKSSARPKAVAKQKG